jgi:hypothetical protein
MEKILNGSVGSKVDIHCGHGANFSGKVLDCGDGIVRLEMDDKRIVQISVEKIVAVTASNEHSPRPGFIV